MVGWAKIIDVWPAGRCETPLSGWLAPPTQLPYKLWSGQPDSCRSFIATGRTSGKRKAVQGSIRQNRLCHDSMEHSGIDEHACVVRVARQHHRLQGRNGEQMTASFTMQDSRDHFAHCVQVLGGVTASSRRLGIDERAIRRFVNGELPLSIGVLEDTAKALRLLIAEAKAAEEHIAAVFGSKPNAP